MLLAKFFGVRGFVCWICCFSGIFEEVVQFVGGTLDGGNGERTKTKKKQFIGSLPDYFTGKYREINFTHPL